MNILAVSELVIRNANDPILVGHEIGEDDAGLHQEVEVGRVADRARVAFGRLLGGSRCSHVAADLVVIFPADRGPLLAGVGLADHPRIQQEAGADQHITGKRSLFATFKDVTVLVTDVTAAEIEVAEGGARQHDGRRLVGWAEGIP